MNYRKYFLSGVMAFGLCLGGCQSEAPKAETPQSAAKEKPVAKEKPAPSKESSKTCRLKSFSFSLKAMSKGQWVKKQKTMAVTYDENGKMLQSIGTEEGSDVQEKIDFAYDEKGRMLTAEVAKSKANQNKGLKATYVYAEDGKLMKIKGEGALTDRAFEYNEKGQIAKEITFFGGKPFRESTFEYDEKGAPHKVTMSSAKGKMQMDLEFEFDDKKNPFVNLSLLNAGELFGGYPVGNYQHNIVRRTKLKKKSPAKDGGQELKYQYNGSGYPTVLIETNKGEENMSTFEYDCS